VSAAPAEQPSPQSLGRRSLTTAAVVATAITLGTVAGFGREAAIAGRFGAGSETDAYLTAIFLPMILLQLLTTGPLTALLVPSVSGLLELGDDRGAWKVVGTVAVISVAFLAVASLAAALAAPLIVALLAPGFDPDVRGLATSLTRAMAPLFLFVGAASVLVSLLNAFQRFTAAALTSLAFNLVVIAGALSAGAIFGIWGLATGTLLAGAVQLAVVLFDARRLPGKRYLRVDLRSPQVRRIARSLVPVVLLAVVSQAYFALERVIASHLEPGSVTTLNYALRLAMFPLGFSTALTVVSFPLMSRQVARRDQARFLETLSSNSRLIFFVTVPLSVLLASTAGPVVRVLLGRGAFGVEDAAVTAAALRFYSLGLVAHALTWQFTRALYALGDFRSPLVIHLVLIPASLPVNIALSRAFGQAGLAAGLSIITAAIMVTLVLALRWRTPGFDLWPLAVSAGRMCAAGGVMCLVLLAAGPFADGWSNPGLVRDGAYLTLGGGLGLLAYLAAASALRLPELASIIDALPARLRRVSRGAPVPALATSTQAEEQ